MRSNKNELKKIAEKRIKELFSQAKDNPKMGNRYVQLARKLAMKVNYKMPSNLRRRFCKHCYSYFNGDNYRVRTREKMLVYFCHSCNRYSRFGLKKKA
jgi:ribonuclease P protein subunit RPR2